MSAHRTPADARHIVQVLRMHAEDGVGGITPSEVEVLEDVLRTNAELLKALREVSALKVDVIFENHDGYPSLQVDGGSHEDPDNRGRLIGGVDVNFCGPEAKALEVAALFAAAPELLAALRVLRPRAGVWKIPNDAESAMIDAAIAKAGVK